MSRRFKSLCLYRVGYVIAQDVLKVCKKYMPELCKNIFVEVSSSKYFPFRVVHRIKEDGKRKYISSLSQDLLSDQGGSRFQDLDLTKQCMLIVRWSFKLQPQFYKILDIENIASTINFIVDKCNSTQNEVPERNQVNRNINEEIGKEQGEEDDDEEVEEDDDEEVERDTDSQEYVSFKQEEIIKSNILIKEESKEDTNYFSSDSQKDGQEEEDTSCLIKKQSREKKEEYYY